MKKRATLPILLKNQSILLLGGGNVALQKAEVLAKNNISFKIISKTFKPSIKRLSDVIEKKSFQLSDIGSYFIIIDATGSQKVTKKLLKYKKKYTLLLNVVDKPEYCDFYFMALTKNRPLQIAVSSSGVSPTLAQYFRDRCEDMIPEDLKYLIASLKKKREKGIIDVKSTLKEVKKLSHRAYLVGCGLGDPELLTLKAYKVIQNVDVVLYDHLISKEIMDSVPKGTKRVFVGKEKGFHSQSQDEINCLIKYYIDKGKSVARLKSGDPFIFGRGAEELDYLMKHKIKTEVVAGISSCISASLMANIPITARDYADSFTVVSAHLQGNRINLDWIEALHHQNRTMVVLMGLSKVDNIVHEAFLKGVNPSTPCAIISNASRLNQKVILTTLKKLKKEAKNALRPSILVFGNVVNFTKNLECYG